MVRGLGGEASAAVGALTEAPPSLVTAPEPGAATKTSDDAPTSRLAPASPEPAAQPSAPPSATHPSVPAGCVGAAAPPIARRATALEPLDATARRSAGGKP